MKHIDRKREIEEVQMKIIGLTGSVGSGKSTVGKCMEEHFGIKLQMTDEIAHLVYKKNTDSYEKIIQLLGTDILDSTGEIDRKKVADKVFLDKKLLEQLNAIIHPWVKEYLRKDIEHEKSIERFGYYIIESAIMFQTGLDHMCDEVWYVDAEDAIRRKRLKSDRGYSDEKIDGIMAHQSSNDRMKEQCKHVIDNNGDKTVLVEQLQKLLV